MAERLLTVAFVVLVLIKAVSQGSLTIEMPKGSFCELDNLANCGEKDCIRFDPNIQKITPSLVTILTDGQRERMITAYITMLWVKWQHNLPVFMERSTRNVLKEIFDGVEMFPTLEDNICDYSEFKFQRLNLDLVQSLAKEEYRIGKALALNADINNALPGWWKLHKKYQRKTKSKLKFLPEIKENTEKIFHQVAKKVCIFLRNDFWTFFCRLSTIFWKIASLLASS